MDAGLRTQVILSAVGAAGPKGDSLAEWNAKVRANALDIASMIAEGSDLVRLLDKFADSKPFPATILGGRVEASSTRVIVRFLNKDGEEEEIRTDRTDTPEGLAMANTVRGLKHHKVLIYKEIEEYNQGKGKVRVLRHIVDLGIDPQHAQAASAAA